MKARMGHCRPIIESTQARSHSLTSMPPSSSHLPSLPPLSLTLTALHKTMNFSHHASAAFITLDMDGNRVLSKCCRQQNIQSSPRGLANVKDQWPFEKGRWRWSKNSRRAPAVILRPLAINWPHDRFWFLIP